MPAGGCQVISLRVKVDDKPPSGLLENCIEVMALDENDDPICARGCSRVFVGITDPLIVTKTADKESVERGKKVKYSIEVHNIYAVENLNEVTVKDAFSRDVEFITAEPAPVQKYDEGDSLREIVWIFDQIKPGDFEDITLEVLVPEMQDFEFGMEQSVSGEGFVNAANDYSTTSPNYNLNNVVIVTAVNDTNVAIKASDSANVEVTDPGTELSTREHGSGSYESEDLVTVKTEDKSIEMAKDVSATFATTALGLYNNRSVTYSSRWTETACGKNRITGHHHERGLSVRHSHRPGLILQARRDGHLDGLRLGVRGVWEASGYSRSRPPRATKPTSNPRRPTRGASRSARSPTAPASSMRSRLRGLDWSLPIKG